MTYNSNTIAAYRILSSETEEEVHELLAAALKEICVDADIASKDLTAAIDWFTHDEPHADAVKLLNAAKRAFKRLSA